MGGEVSRKNSANPARLEELSIKGLGVIDQTTVEFTSGFNVITGETGAGKTMVLTALALLLGGKSDAALIRSQSERLVVSGRFNLDATQEAKVSESILDQGGEVDNGALLFTRTVSRDGKSRATIGGASSTASVLSEISSHLIAIHGQHASLSLSKNARQRELLDSFAATDISQPLKSYQEELLRYQEMRERISSLRRSIDSRDREIGELQELVKDFQKLKPRSGEIEDLSIAIARLGSVEDLRNASSGALSALDSEDSGALGVLASARRFLQQEKGRDPQLDGISESLNDAFYSLSELANDLSRYVDSLNADPGALEEAQQRKAALTSFAKKFGAGDYEAVLIRAKESAARIADLQGGDDVLAKLESESEAILKALTKAAQEVSAARVKAAGELSSAITKELALLSMPSGRFSITVTSASLTQDTDFKEHGVDEIEMLFTSHGGDLLPISKAASGGELSRLLLAIEVTIAGREERGCYVFDEVDAGIGGKAALEVGRRLRKLAQHAQVIVVTHLPQVALWADHHIVITKDESGSITTSSLRVVDGQDRESEIARMLSGLEDSEHAQDHARELLQLRKVESG